MFKLIIKFALLGGVVWYAAENLEGISVIDYKTAVMAAISLSLLNTVVKPVVKLISLPINVITLGLFGFVVSAGMVMLMDYFVDGFGVASFIWALIFSLIISAAGTVIGLFTD